MVVKNAGGASRFPINNRSMPIQSGRFLTRFSLVSTRFAAIWIRFGLKRDTFFLFPDRDAGISTQRCEGAKTQRPIFAPVPLCVFALMSPSVDHITPTSPSRQ